MAMLQTHNLNKHFGGLHVTADVSFSLEPGKIHCLIGPNGAGKSTFFRLLLGEHQPSSGTIVFDGKDITRLKPFQRINQGMSVKFQVPGIFGALSAQQNLQIALQHRLRILRPRCRSRKAAGIPASSGTSPTSWPATSATA